jgi:hypothetical protein
MKITDFTRKSKLVATDFLIGFDGKGNPIRVSMSDLATSLGVTTVKAESVQVQYSLNKSSWHTPFVEGDRYMRVKCGSGAWSDAICISVSAYETWKEQNGGSGTKEEFLASLKGEAGASVDVSKLKLSEMDGYKSFTAAVEESIDEAVGNYQKAMSAKIAAIEEQLKVLTTAERTVIALKGDQDSRNVTFTADSTFAAGTSQLFINGKRYVAGSDYLEVKNREIVLLTHVPEKDDVMVFVAVNAEQG